MRGREEREKVVRVGGGCARCDPIPQDLGRRAWLSFPFSSAEMASRKSLETQMNPPPSGHPHVK